MMKLFVIGFVLIMTTPVFAGLPIGAELKPGKVMTMPNIDSELVVGKTVQQALLSTANFLLYLFGGIAILVLIWGGVQYLTSGGDADKAKTSSATVRYAVIGIILIMLSYSIVTTVVRITTDRQANLQLQNPR